MSKLVTMNGKPIIDAKEPFEFNITLADIRKAQQSDATCCAVAQSLKRHKDILATRVGTTSCYVEKQDIVLRYMQSREGTEKIKAFDAANYFGAGKWLLLPPKPSQAIGARAGTKAGSNKRTGKALTLRTRAALRHVFAPGKDDKGK